MKKREAEGVRRKVRGGMGERLEKWIVAALLLTVLAGAATAEALTGDIKHDPTEVITKYAQLDYKGVRLNAASQPVLDPYVEWRDEPAWGSVVVVADYTVLGQTKEWDIISMLEARIPVEYRVLGTVYWGTASFLPAPGTERISFRVRGRAMRWRIVEPQIPPHVGVKRMINFVRQAILQETDPAHIAKLTALRDELEKVK